MLLKKSLVSYSVVIALALMLVVGSASAATITFHLVEDELGPGTFGLYATTDSTAGISGYGLDLLGVTSLDHNSPNATQDDGSFTVLGPVGFRLGRSGDNNSFVVGAHDLIDADACFLYGVGNSPGTMLGEGCGPLILGAEPVSQAWGAPHPLIAGSPVQLATGTHGGAINFNPGGPNLGANVWTAVDASTVETAQIAFNFIPIPEPGTLVLACFGLVGMVAGRRRS